MSSVNTGELNNALLAISHSLADRSQLASTMDAILAAARQLTRANHGIIYVLDQTGEALVPLAVHHTNKPQRSHPWSALKLAQRKENDPLGFALQTGESIIINELYQYNGYDCEDIYAAETTLGIQSRNLLVWPLKDHQYQTVGLLVLFDLSDIKDEAGLAVFTKLAGTSIRQAVLLETYGSSIKRLSADNAALSKENKQLKQRTKPDYSGPIANSDVMISVMDRLQRILRLPVDVLLRGETGSGKEVIARYIHDNSDQANKPFIAQNCAAIPDQLLESELFGHKKGAFTGADKDKIGLFEAADGGTLFLDEIGDMPLLLQSKLLRVLQERTIRPVGSSKEHNINVRVIAATHCNLMDKIKSNEFRADLFYRLNVFPVTLPALRERKTDILPLAEHFIVLTGKKLGLDLLPVLSQKARNQLLQYHYPGNVRELRNVIERAVLLSDMTTIESIEIQDELETGLQQKIEPPDIDQLISLKDVVNNYERDIILDCLNTYNWQTKRVAEQLALPMSTLNHKIKKYAIAP